MRPRPDDLFRARFEETSRRIDAGRRWVDRLTIGCVVAVPLAVVAGLAAAAWIAYRQGWL